ncbi:MAG: hypothetical protein KME31_09665 [Tolypothrix carrinoi HA7290-LM1]|nr:hypothetical protein [Tolypothrix carrinoi HA7290-LM1]
MIGKELLPMPNDGRCASAGKPLRQSLMGVTNMTALPMPTHSQTYAQCPITNYQLPIPNAQNQNAPLSSSANYRMW